MGTFQPKAALFVDAPYPLSLSNLSYVLSSLFRLVYENGTFDSSAPLLKMLYSRFWAMIWSLVRVRPVAPFVDP